MPRKRNYTNIHERVKALLQTAPTLGLPREIINKKAGELTDEQRELKNTYHTIRKKIGKNGLLFDGYGAWDNYLLKYHKVSPMHGQYLPDERIHHYVRMELKKGTNLRQIDLQRMSARVTEIDKELKKTKSPKRIAKLKEEREKLTIPTGSAINSLRSAAAMRRGKNGKLYFGYGSWGKYLEAVKNNFGYKNWATVMAKTIKDKMGRKAFEQLERDYAELEKKRLEIRSE